MKKKSFSLQRLPQFTKQKKDLLNQKNQLFQQKLKGIERLQMQNELSKLKMKPYETMRNFKKDLQFRSQEKAHKVIKILSKHDKFVDLEPIKQLQYHSTRRILNPIPLKTPSKKMDIEGFLKEKNDLLIEEQLKLVEIQNNRRQYLPSIIESERKTFPFFNQTTKKYQEEPFIKLQEKEDKVKIRFLNGFEKLVSKSNLKQIHQNQALTLQSYRKLMKKDEIIDFDASETPENREIIQKINIDHNFLNKMLNQVYAKKNPRTEIKKLLKELLYVNYEESVKEFNRMFVEKRQIKRVNRFQRKNRVSSDIKDYVDHHLVCSYDLQFLDLYMLSKTHYISTMVQSYNIVGKIQRFQHFTKLFIINDTPKFIEEAVLSKEIIKYFSDQRDKIENIIYSLEEHLNVLVRNLYKDIEHIIFLNPRLVGNNYQSDVKKFINSFSSHLSRIIRSVIIYSINTQLENLSQFYEDYSKKRRHSLQAKQAMTSEFNSQIFAINEIILNENMRERIAHGPGVIPIALSLKKWKRKKYNNIFRFIIQCRANIRKFCKDNWKEFKCQEERIINKEPLQILQSTIISPISKYLQYLNDSENVNGCIFNQKIEMLGFIDLERFSKKMMRIYEGQREEKVKMFVSYFQQWQLYFMEKPYIDDFIQLYRNIKAIKLIEEEMGYLKQDLALIKSFPNIIEIHFIRLDISEIKTKIETTIQAFIKKILKTCEQTLGKMLQYGYEQTIKAKKLNEVTPYTNLAEYIGFINFLNKREVEKSIQKIAENVVFIDSNMTFLQKNQYEIKFAMMQRYLQSGTWIKKIRAAAAENKQKTSVDPFMFLKGVKDKRTKILTKYNKILKEIIELMKVNELKNSTKLSILAKNIAHQMKQICVSADQILNEETLLELQYAPADPKLIDEDRIYRTDLTFFYKEQRFLKKYLHFWSYVAKLRTVVDNIHERRILDVDGIELVRLLREGQQLISSIKISTLNKRFLHLCDEVMKQIDPFLKCSKLFLLLTSGSESYRVKVIKNLMNQTSSTENNTDPLNLTVKELIDLPLSIFDWHGVYKIKQEEQLYESCKLKLNIVYSIIKNLDFVIRELKGVGKMREFQLIMIDENTIRIVKQCLQSVRSLQEKYSTIFKNKDHQQDHLVETSKKINIFYRSILKLKTASDKIIRFYSIFQMVYPSLYPILEELNLNAYYVAYENMIVDLTKKADLVKKLSYATFYDDKVRISYDEELKKLQQFQIRVYNEIIDRIHNKTYFGFSQLEKQTIYMALSCLGLEGFNELGCKLMGEWCKNIKFRVEYDNDYYIVLQEMQTIYKEKVKVNRRQKLFEIKKYLENDMEKVDIKCGVLTLVQHTNKQLSRKIQEQTSQIIRIIYEYHYNIKHIFYLYLHINNLYLQSVLNALMIVFHLDLSMLYENKYDLNLLLQTLQEGRIYSPKEKDSCIYTQALTRIIDEFIAIINVLQERQYCLEDVEKGRIRKMYAFHSLPKLQLQGLSIEDDKHWLEDLKQEKEDDFIHFTHLSPSLLQLNLLLLDSAKVEAKQIQKKEEISDFDEELNIQHMIVEHQLNRSKTRQSQRNRVKLVANIAPHLRLKTTTLAFKYQIVNKNNGPYYIFDSFRAAELLIQAISSHKVLVTNIHPNYQILGRNFLKTTKFIPNYHKDMAVIVHSEKELLACLKLIMAYQRNKLNKFIYIYYDKLSQESIQSEIVDESCIVFQAGSKLHFNHLLKKQLNFNEKQIFTTFIQTQSHFESCHPFSENPLKVIPNNTLKFILDSKERDMLTGLIYTYQNHQGLSAHVTEQKITMLSHPIYSISSSHFLMNYFFDIGEYIYTRMIKIASTDKDIEIINTFVNTLLNKDQHTLAAYVLPIYSLTRQEIFTTIQYQSYDQKIQDRYEKDVYHVKTVQKPKINVGMINELISFLSGNAATLSQRWDSFRLKGNQDALVRWFIIDLSQDIAICRQVFSYFMQCYSNGQYVFQNGEHYSTDIHFTQKLLKEHKHKIIFITHPNLFDEYRTDFPPIPIINESLRFDPLREFKITLAAKIKKLPTTFMELVNIPEILQTFRAILSRIDIDILTISSQTMMGHIFFIMLNQVRKREIALGHYSESILSSQQSKENLYGSIDLKERNKLQQEHLIELQEIEKKMDLTRREIHKVYMNNLKYEQLLTKDIYDRLEGQFQILNPTNYNRQEINDTLKKALIFSFYYSVVLARPEMKEQLSKQLEPLTQQPLLYNYCYSLQLNKWQRWEQIDTNLTTNSCTPGTSCKVLHPKEILRHNLSKFKLQTLKDYSDDMDTIHGVQPPLITIKGPEIYFLKLFILYQIPTKLTLPQSSYPSWVFEYELSLLKKISNTGEPYREIPQPKNKKLSRMLGLIKIKGMVLKQLEINTRTNLAEWKSVVQYGIFRSKQQWFRIRNTCVYFIDKSQQPQHSKYGMLKSQIRVEKGQGQSPYSLLTAIYNLKKFQAIESNLDSAIISLKTYHNLTEFLQHYRFRQFYPKGLTSQQVQEIFGVKLSIANTELYLQGRKRMKEVVNKIKLQQAENKEEFTAEQLEKIRTFDRIPELDQALGKLMSSVEVVRSQISSNFVVRYLLKKPRKYERIDSPQQIAPKKRLKSPAKVEFDDILLYDNNYDRSNIQGEDLSQGLLFFNLNERVLLVETTGPFDQALISKCMLSYKCYIKAGETMLANKNTKPFSVDFHRLQNFEVNCKLIPIFNADSLKELEEQLTQSATITKNKLRILTVYNEQIMDKLLTLFHRHLLNTIYQTGYHYYIILTPKLSLPYHHGLRTILEDRNQKINHMTDLRREKKIKLVAKLQEYTKKMAIAEIEQSNIGKDYIPILADKMTDIKIHTSNVKNDLMSKKDVYQQTIQEIQLASRSVTQCKESIQSSQRQIKKKQSSLQYWKIKRQFYTGNQEFKEINRHLRQFQRKRLQKQLNRPEYIQDNPYNISYIFIFNILADNSYFQDKSLPLLEQEYQLHKNYQIPEDQKKLFQKHFNYGRLNAIIDNDELTLGETLITEDHLIMSDKIRNKFVFLRHVHDAIFQQKKYDKENPFSLQHILREELVHIKWHRSLEGEEIFNKYIAYLFTHKYIKYIIVKSIEGLQSQLKKTREAIVKMREKIEHEQLRFSSNQTYLEQIKSKYEINQRELDICKKNQVVFMQSANQNLLIISQFFVKQLTGLVIDYQFSLANRMSNDIIRKREGKKEKRKNKEEEEVGNQQLKEEGVIREIKQSQVICSLAEYVIDQMDQFQRRDLQSNQKQFLLTIIPKETLQAIVRDQHIQTVEQFYQSAIIYLIKSILPYDSVLFPSQHFHNSSKLQELLDYSSFNLISLKEKHRSETHYLCREIQSNYCYEIKGIIGRVAHKKTILDNILLKFTEKIGLVQAKSTESIGRFLLQVETVSNIQESFVNALKTVTNTASENMYYSGEWMAKNQERWDYYSSVVQMIRQKMRRLYGQYSDNMLLYYIRLVGMICKKVPLENAESVIDQIYYDHSFDKNVSVKQVKEALIQKRYETKPEDENKDNQESKSQTPSNLCYISTLDSILSTPINIILVHGSSLLSKILLVKALRTNKVLKKRQDIQFYLQENTSKQYWILINVSPSLEMAEIVKKVGKLKNELALSEENHMKFIIFFQSNVWKEAELSHICSTVQPIYRFFFENSPTSIYYHSSYIFHQYSQRTTNNELPTVFTLAKYYCGKITHIPVSHIALSGLEDKHLAELLENLFEGFDVHSQSIFFRIVLLLCRQLQPISLSISDKLAKVEKEPTASFFPLWPEEPQFDAIRPSFISSHPSSFSFLSQWMMKIVNEIGRQHSYQKNNNEKVSFSELMKSGRDEMGFLVDAIENSLSNPYKFIAINNCFGKLIEKIIAKRNRSKNTVYLHSQGSKDKTDLHQLVEINNKTELFLEIMQGANSNGLRLNNITVQITLKEVSGSIGVGLRMQGEIDEWAKNIFQGDLFMVVGDKRHKNSNELNYVKGVNFRYSQPILYVKKEVQFGEEDTNVLRPLPQYKSILPVNASNGQFLGLIELITNQSLTQTPTLMLRLAS